MSDNTAAPAVETSKVSNRYELKILLHTASLVAYGTYRKTISKYITELLSISDKYKYVSLLSQDFVATFGYSMFAFSMMPEYKKSYPKILLISLGVVALMLLSDYIYKREIVGWPFRKIDNIDKNNTSDTAVRPELELEEIEEEGPQDMDDEERANKPMVQYYRNKEKGVRCDNGGDNISQLSNLTLNLSEQMHEPEHEPVGLDNNVGSFELL